MLHYWYTQAAPDTSTGYASDVAVGEQDIDDHGVVPPWVFSL
jgi:hypothetical protein